MMTLCSMATADARGHIVGIGIRMIEDHQALRAVSRLIHAAARLDAYHFERRYAMGANPTCGACGMAASCGKGCPAAVISAGERIGAVDAEVCPVTSGERRLLPLMPA